MLGKIRFNCFIVSFDSIGEFNCAYPIAIRFHPLFRKIFVEFVQLNIIFAFI